MNALLATVVVAGTLLALALALTRLLRGPSQADRVVALDVVFSASVAMAAAAALATGRVLFLDVAVGLAVVGFVATIVWARLIDKSPEDPR
ncbi:MAG: monovalent cation/H+ antiporter complex subunit F [Rehaibacterium terrae]|jgi:multicomponent Na+:H+ antiporter subunit F|uniref:monovalent cation/H+ antiporter complex subunit F n=1 Tax=Rehaibacterium terrae TaxID=1341696 RepID=UPI00391C433E